MVKKKLVKVCPNCGSTNISVDATEGGAFNFCRDCDFGNFRNQSILKGGNQTGYTQLFPEIEESKAVKLKAKLSKLKKKK